MSYCMDCGAGVGVAHDSDCATHERDREPSLWPGERMDAIGQNGNEGDHYPAGRKDDAEKPRMDLLLSDMPRALEAIAQVLTYGARKYSDGNWMDVDNAQRRYLAAGARHELEFAKGFTVDEETGEHHLAHAACCLLFRLELLLREGAP